MCGIAGVSAGATELDAALDRLEFRGRDGRGSCTLGGYGIGCCRLAITDPETPQPVSVERPGGRVAIVMNGSLAGPESLARLCARAGEPVASGNDAELPLRLYLARGAAGLTTLRGQFAFAILDERDASLTLGRDAFGEKPLFVAPRAGTELPAFSSTVAALGVLQPAAAVNDPGAAARFALHGFCDLEASCFGLPYRALPRGTIRTYTSGGSTIDHALDRPRAPAAGDDDSLVALLERVVRDRMHGDVEIAVFLSGGVDSALVAWLATEVGERPVCASLDFEGQIGEGARAAAVARELGLRHIWGKAGADCLDRLPDLIRCAGVPLGDPSILAVHRVSSLARDAGAGIALTGDGGDELFLGYRRQRAYAWARHARRSLPAPWLAGASRLGGRLLRSAATGSYDEMLTVAEPTLVERLFGVELEPRAADTAAPLTAARRDDIASYLAHDLCPKLDLASLHAGIEARSPLLDSELRAFAERHAVRTGEARGKPRLRALLARRFGTRLRDGRKHGFAPPVARWLAERPWVRDVLGDVDAGFDRGRALALLAAVENGQKRHALVVFALLALALHVDARSARG